MSNVEKLLVGPDWTIRRLILCVEANAHGIALVVDGEQRLLSTVTDGDIRRAVLQGLALEATIQELIARKEPEPTIAAGPITAPDGTDDAALLDLMRRHSVRHIPLLDGNGRVVGLSRIEDLVESPKLNAVVMAGGFGTRLRPLTHETPKPILPVGDRSLLERILGQLRDAGIHRVNIATHFLADRVKEHVGDGSRLGLAVEYLSEDRPLGTAGALGLLEAPDEPVLVINGDILTRTDFRAMLHFHQDYKAVMTVGIKQYSVKVPFGVVQVRGAEIAGLEEKPVAQFFVVAGIYLLSPEVWKYLPRGEHCDMPDLIRRLVGEGQKVVSFPINEYWLDVGCPDDYQQAQSDVADGRV